MQYRLSQWIWYAWISINIIPFPQNRDMTKFVKHARLICISNLEKDLNIDWLADEIEIEWACFKNFSSAKLGTDRFLNSVKTVTIDYSITKNKPDVQDNLDMMQECFKNLQRVNLKNLQNLSLSEIAKICFFNDKVKFL